MECKLLCLHNIACNVPWCFEYLGLSCINWILTKHAEYWYDYVLAIYMIFSWNVRRKYTYISSCCRRWYTLYQPFWCKTFKLNFCLISEIIDNIWRVKWIPRVKQTASVYPKKWLEIRNGRQKDYHWGYHPANIDWTFTILLCIQFLKDKIIFQFLLFFDTEIWKFGYIHPMNPLRQPCQWLSVRLQHLQCVSNGDTAVDVFLLSKIAWWDYFVHFTHPSPLLSWCTIIFFTIHWFVFG